MKYIMTRIVFAVFYASLFCRADSFVDRFINDRGSAHTSLHRNLKTVSSIDYTGRNIATTVRVERSKTSLAAVTASDAVSSAAISAILKLLSACGLGAAATKFGILDKNALSVLSKLVFNVFQPCLLFVNVAGTLSKSKASDSSLYLLPIAAAIQIVIGFSVGKIVSRIIYGKEDSDDKRQLIACNTFSNSGPLPLVFTDSIFRLHSNPLLLQKSVAGISMYLLAWSPLFWVLGPMILSSSTSNMTPKQKRDLLLKRVFSPPIIGCLSGLAVGSSTFLCDLVTKRGGLLNPIFEAMSTLAGGYLPAVLLVLAGSLVPSGKTDPDDISQNASSTASASSTGLFIKRVLVVYASKFLLMPLLAFGGYRLIQARVPWLASMLSDKLLVFILLLEACMPSAQNSTVILQLEGKTAAAASMARTLVALYILGLPAMTFWLTTILRETALLA